MRMTFRFRRGLLRLRARRVWRSSVLANWMAKYWGACAASRGRPPSLSQSRLQGCHPYAEERSGGAYGCRTREGLLCVAWKAAVVFKRGTAPTSSFFLHADMPSLAPANTGLTYRHRVGAVPARPNLRRPPCLSPPGSRADPTTETRIPAPDRPVWCRAVHQSTAHNRADSPR